VDRPSKRVPTEENLFLKVDLVLSANDEEDPADIAE
jgi:hypothetical protein